MSRRFRTSLLLGCLGVGLLYAPDCARILENAGELSVVHAAEWRVGAPFDSEVAQRTGTPPEPDAAVSAAPEFEDYVGGE